MEEIRNYLEQEEKSYQDGVSLLSKYCANRILVNTLSKRESAAHWAKLEHELRKMLEQQSAAKFPAVASLTPPVPDTPPAAPDGATTGGEINPPAPDPVVPYVSGSNADVDQLVTERSRLYSERCILSNSLADASSDEERQGIIAKIDAIEASRAAVKEKIVYFEQHGKLPEVASAKPEVSEMDKADLIKTRNNLRSQLSKARKAAIAKPNDVAKQEKLAKVEIELSSVELQLKQISEIESREEASNEQE